MKIASIVGGCPQFIMCAPLSRQLRRRHRELLIHTGQHDDPEMSRAFFDQLDIPHPDIDLGIGSGPTGDRTARMLWGLEEVLLQERPDAAVVFGDTNSTLAGSLAAAKLHIPVAHVEAGLRSFDHRMPEEINRVLTDRLSAQLFCPTETAVNNLRAEGIIEGVHNTGDVVVDALRQHAARLEQTSAILQRLDLNPGDYYLAAVHWADNIDRRDHLSNLIAVLARLDRPVIFPVHPRTRRAVTEHHLHPGKRSSLRLIDPVSHPDLLMLEKNARKILTDSGETQKEAFLFQIPCITLRGETEWPETLREDWNTLTGADPEAITRAVLAPPPKTPTAQAFGGGRAAEKMAGLLETLCSSEG
jgi:UDP-N-acetylglucosamine 2-epimerase